MIKVFYGKKGTGKTVRLVETANKKADADGRNVVFIDNDNALIYSLNHDIRFINVAEFPISDPQAFIGFICGVLSCNYDIGNIFIDGLNYILGNEASVMEDLFNTLKEITEKQNVDFYISISGEPEMLPGFLNEFLDIKEKGNVK